MPTEERTRQRVLDHVLRLGPVSAAELAERLDVTPTAVRRHLEQLTDSGDIAPSEAAGEPSVAVAADPRGTTS